jgi:hypothetical protein
MLLCGAAEAQKQRNKVDAAGVAHFGVNAFLCASQRRRARAAGALRATPRRRRGGAVRRSARAAPRCLLGPKRAKCACELARWRGVIPSSC